MSQAPFFPGSWGTVTSEFPTPAPQDVWHRQIHLVARAWATAEDQDTAPPSPCSQSVSISRCLVREDIGPDRPSPRPSSHHTHCHFISLNEVTNNCKSVKIPTQQIEMESQKRAKTCLKVIAANLQRRWTQKEDIIKAKKAFNRQILLQIFGLIQPVCKHSVYYQYSQTFPLQGLLKKCILLKMINLHVTCSLKSQRSWGLGDEHLVEIHLSYKH